MERNQLLQNNSEFAGMMVVGKLSTHHDGEREVYRAKCCKTGELVALTVFNLGCKRYATDHGARKRKPDFIEEVRFYKKCAAAAGYKDIMGVPKYIDSGIATCNRHRYGWVAQEYVDGDTLDVEIRRQDVISIKDSLEIIKKVSFIVEALAGFTHGGGHYNISTDNIIVRYERDELKDVRLIGFTNIGTSYSGQSPIEDGDVDCRFRAPETYKQIYSYYSDIYSLGMVLLLMLVGYPKVIQTENYSINIGSGALDLTDITSMDFYNSMWAYADKNLSNALRLILRKATDISPTCRFASIEKFNGFLAKIGKKAAKTKTIAEEDDYDENDRPSFIGTRPRSEFEAFEIRKAALSGNKKPSFSQSKRRNALDEVAGMDDLKAKFRRNFVQILRNPQIAEAYGITPCNCTLLFGPQGCGKTFIAEKAAQESGLKYRIVNPSDLGSVYIHGSQEKIAETFKDAEKNAPMILIFDEFDAIAPKRDGELNPNQANEVNELLTRLNNCAEKGVFVLATTNRPELVDSAILRTGRVDEMYYVPLPDFKARYDIFSMELGKRPCREDIDLDALAQATENYTCSDLSYIVKESARRCFDETIASGTDSPIPLSQRHLLDVIKHTRASVSPSELKSYGEMRERIEHRDGKERPRVGFFTSN